MTVERYIRIFAGLFILVSLALGVEQSPFFVSKWALAFTAFVGLNLLQLIMVTIHFPNAGATLDGTTGLPGRARSVGWI